MAATQAESQLNDTNREHLHEKPSEIGNSTFQNGTEKNGSKNVGSDGGKVKFSTHNYSADMSQERQENCGPSMHNEQNDECGAKHNSEKAYLQNIDNGSNEINYNKGLPESANAAPNVQNYLPYSPRSNYSHPDHSSSQMNSTEGGNAAGSNANSNNMHQNSVSNQYGNMANVRHNFPNSKPGPGPRPMAPHMNTHASNFNPHGHPQRFMSGQSISQQMGPTPTLNQLLQSSNPVHRYQNNYSEYTNQKPNENPQAPFNHGWNTRPMPPYMNQQGYRGQMPNASVRCNTVGVPPGPGGGPYPHQPPPGGSVPGPPPAASYPSHPQPPSSPSQQPPGGPPGPPQQYQPYPQRYPAPSGPPQQAGPVRVPAYPAQHPQMVSPYGPMSQGPPNMQAGGSPYPGEQRLPWPPMQQQQQPGPPQQQQPPPQQGPPPPPQPQQPNSQSPQQQNASQAPHIPPNSPVPPAPSTPTPHSSSSTSQQHSPQSALTSPQSAHPEASPQQTHQPQQSPQHSSQSFGPSRPNLTSTPEPGDLTSQNSNDSSSSGGPQAMRPTPSPTGSTGSRSMSPAIGAYPGRGVQSMPPYHQSYGMQQPGAGSHSQYPARPMPNHVPHTQFPGFQGWPAPNVNVSGPSPGQMSMSGPGAPWPSNHVSGGGGPGKGVPPPASSPQQSQQPPQPPGTPHQANQQHHPMHHMHQPPQQQPQQQQPSQPQPTQPPQSPQQHPPPPQSPQSQQQQSPQMGQNCSPGPGSRSHTPPQYLKQHLQHKVGFNNSSGMPPSPGPPPGMYGNSSPGPGMGPPHHHPMGPPIPAGHHPHMGPGMGHPNMQNMMPPHNSHHDSPMPPPSSTPNSHSLPTPPIQSEASMDGMHEGGAPLTTTASGNMTNVSQINSGGITSVVTTGPDGAPMDEASQQSTLSNTSAASGEDPSSTPKRKESGMGMMGSMGGYLGHGHSQGPAPPCSPGMNSMHDDYPSEGNAPWSRTPSSPVFNSHMSQDMYRSKKHDSLSKLYEMDDSPERRGWVDKLLHFMEERGSPITTCPTISKNPLDLFRLYVYVKERGGFVEGTKNKIWKDIAGLLGIGASSSAAYTLRRHYTKNLLPFECRFDRGGIDPQPIINQVESSTKKKNAKNASVPSPGSSNSQDSFPSGSGGGMDGYGGYGYSSEYGNQRGPPTMQSNQGMSSQPGGYQSQPGYNQYPPDQYGQQYMSGGSYPPSRPMYPVYPPDAERGYSQNSSSNAMGPSTGPQQQSAPSPAVSQGPSGADPYSRSPYGQPMYHPRPPFSGPGQPPQQPPSSTSQTSNSHVVPSPPRPDSQPSPSPYPPSPQQPPSQSQTPQPPSQQHIPSQQPQQPPGPPQQPTHQPPPQPPNQASQPPGAPQQQPPTQIPPSQSPHDFYRPDQPYLNQNHIPSPGSGTYPGPGGPNKGMPPPPIQQSRRHPDFTKDSQQSPPPTSYSPYNNQQQRPMFPGWPQENSNRNQYVRGPYPQPQAGVPPNAPPQQWGQSPMPRPPVPPNAQPPNAQWEQHRYPPNAQQQSFPPPQPGQWNMQSGGPPMVQNSNLRPPRANFRDKPFPPMPPSQAVKTMPPGQVPPQAVFASSAAAAVLKREPIFPADSVEAVTPLMYKRKRLTKNDVAPVDAWKLMMSLRSGLLTETCWALDVLNILLFDDTGVQYFGLAHLPGLLDILMEHFNRSLNDMLENAAEKNDRKWYEKPWRESTEPDLGRVTEPIDDKDRLPLKTNLPDYSMKSRRGSPVATVDGTDDLFVKNGPRRWEDGPISIEDVVEPDSRYIVSCFRSEFGIVPFARLLPEIKNKCKKRKSDTNTDSDINHRTKTEEKPDLIIKSEPAETTVKSEPMDDESNASVKDEPDKKDDEDDDAESSDLEDKLKENNCKLNDPMGSLKRRKLSRYEDECYTRDEASLYLITDTQDAIARRCICLSTILRNLTFIPGNECEFSKNSSYLALMGKLLLIHHEHPLRTQKQQNYDREDDTDFTDCCSSLQGESEWWWDFLHQIRENVLVSIANIAGYVDLSNYLEEVSRPILDGLLHWAVCPAAQGQDPFLTASSLSPQKLALEALCKICVTDANVDLVIATPPYSRLQKLTTVLTRLLCRSEEQVLREFAINLLHYLAAAESSMSRIIALQSPCISLLVAFIEQAEQSALGVANQHGINALRDNPESMGTSLDMLRRAARTLLHLSRHPDNKPLFLQQEQRLLALVMSQILDQQVAGIISQVLYQCSRSPSPTSTS